MVEWLASKFPTALPAHAHDGASFTAEEHGQSIHAVAQKEHGVWTARLMQPDAPFMDRAAVAGRTWTTELALAVCDQGVRVGVRVLCASLPFADAPVAYSRPRVVVELAQHSDLRDVRRVESSPWRLTSLNDVADLYVLLTDEKRSLPVYLLTEAEPDRLGRSVRRFLLDEDYLARKLHGVGVVVTLPADLNHEWTNHVGKMWSAFSGAVRTYLPGLNFDEQRPHEHPLALAHRVLSFYRDGRGGETAFSEFLVEQALAYSAAKSVDWDPCVFYADAVQRDLDHSRKESPPAAERLRGYERKIVVLKERAELSVGLAQSYLDDLETHKKLLAEANDARKKLSYYATTLRDQLAAKTGRSPDATVTFPNNYADLPDWVDRNLAGRLILHPRAHRGLKDARYKDPALVYKALLALANEYRNNRLRDADDEEPRIAWERKLGELELRCDGSISPTRAGEEGDTYFVKYPVGSQKKRFIDLHLRKGTTKDDELCLAIYFFWDDEDDVVVIGWLPSHLDNRLT